MSRYLFLVLGLAISVANAGEPAPPKTAAQDPQVGDFLSQAFTEACDQAVGEVVLVLVSGFGRRLFARIGYRNRQAKHKKKVTRHGHPPAESATDYASVSG